MLRLKLAEWDSHLQSTAAFRISLAASYLLAAGTKALGAFPITG